MKQFILRRFLPALALGAAAMAAQSAPINQGAYDATGKQVIGFDGLASGGANGVPVEGLLTFAGKARFGESFAGQTLSVAGVPDPDFDVLSGSPNGPLSLLAGAFGQNLMLIGAGDASPALGGIGPGGVETNPDTGMLEPVFSAAGEGAISILFDADQSSFGFKTIEGTTGKVFLAFFRRDGSLIDSLEVSGLSGGASFGFEREGSVLDIAGVSIWNDDPGGMYFDSFLFNVLADPGTPGKVSEPGALALAGFALLAAGLRRRRR